MKYQMLVFGSVFSLIVSVQAFALDQSPPFSLPALGKSGNVSSADFLGRIVLVDFWASWCGPCRKAMPELEKMRNELKDSGFEVVAINVDEDPKEGLRFLDLVPVSYPVASDPLGTMPEAFGVRVMPTSYLLDAQGRIMWRHQGFNMKDVDTIRARIKAALK